MKWGIIGAMQQEIALIVDKMQDAEITRHYGSNFYTGTIGGADVTVVESGIGKIRAALATHIIINEYGAEKIINTGVAGSMNPALKTLDVVISDQVVFHDADLHYITACYPHRYCFRADEKLIVSAERAAEGLRETNAIVGRIATGDVFVSDPKVKERIAADFDPMCVEMEGAAIGETAYMNGKPFVVIRTISDDAGGEAQMSFDEYMEKAAAVSSTIVLKMITA